MRKIADLLYGSQANYIAAKQRARDAGPAASSVPPGRTPPACRVPVHIHLLAIRHQRQLSFDFESYWGGAEQQ